MIDLTGQEFGKLTVIKRSAKKANSGHATWECRCECGNIATVTSAHLKTGQVSSCGCARKGVNAIDITGKRFGRLTAISPTEKRLGHSIIWKCQCDCGKTCEVASINLRIGDTKSCGCLASEIHRNSISAAKSERSSFQVDGTDALLIATTKLLSNNTSGKKGVSYDISVNLWKAYVTLQKRRYYLGGYQDKNEAIKAREEAEKQIHGPFLSWYAKTYPDKWEKIKKKYNMESNES